ncbi:MAG: hypothetical protein ABI690_10495 [Chloroflexota bacterium]
MSDMVIVEGEIDELPPGAPQGDVEVTIKKRASHTEPILTAEEEAALDAEFKALMNDPQTFTGLSLPMSEILKSPAIGIWKDREDMNR